MSCPNATAPINIVKNNAEVCDKKCDLAFDYPNTSVTAKTKVTTCILFLINHLHLRFISVRKV